MNLAQFDKTAPKKIAPFALVAGESAGDVDHLEGDI